MPVTSAASWSAHAHGHAEHNLELLRDCLTRASVGCRVPHPLTGQGTVLPAAWPVSVSEALCKGLSHEPGPRPTATEVRRTIADAKKGVALGPVTQPTLATTLSRAEHGLLQQPMARILQARPVAA